MGKFNVVSKPEKRKVNKITKKKITKGPVELNSKIKKIGVKNFVSNVLVKSDDTKQFTKLNNISKRKLNKIKVDETVESGNEKAEQVKVLKPNKKKKVLDSPVPGAHVLAPPCLLNEDQVKRGVQIFFELAQRIKSDNDLFLNEKAIFLQINVIKVPKVPSRLVRLNLKHSLLLEDSELCAIVKDVGRKDFEETVAHYQKLLSDHGINCVKTILPYTQFKNEHAREFELRRKLLNLYDFFVVDGSIHGYVAHLLGKEFINKRKMPLTINFKATNLKNEFEKQLKKTPMKIHSKSDCFSVQVGFHGMNSKQVCDNILSVVDGLKVHFPGGLQNVRSLSIVSETVQAIPLYLTLKRNNQVNVPVIQPPRPKQYKPVTDELTTYTNKIVKVLPSGTVIDVTYKHKGRKNSDSFNRVNEEDEEEISEDENYDDDEEENDKDIISKIERENLAENFNLQQKSQKKKKEVEPKSDSDDEQLEAELEEAEELYLQNYEQAVQKNKAVKNKSKKQKGTKRKSSEDDEREDIGEFEVKKATLKKSKKVKVEKKPSTVNENVNKVEKSRQKVTNKDVKKKTIDKRLKFKKDGVRSNLRKNKRNSNKESFKKNSVKPKTKKNKF